MFVQETNVTGEPRRKFNALAKGKIMDMTKKWLKTGMDAVMDLKTFEKRQALSDLGAIKRTQEMCEGSLCPESFEMWEKVKDELYERRKYLLS